MIQIITQQVEMPVLDHRRYQMQNKGKKWEVLDTYESKVVFKRDFETASIACHNLNKKHYLESILFNT